MFWVFTCFGIFRCAQNDAEVEVLLQRREKILRRVWHSYPGTLDERNIKSDIKQDKTGVDLVPDAEVQPLIRSAKPLVE